MRRSSNFPAYCCYRDRFVWWQPQNPAATGNSAPIAAVPSSINFKRTLCRNNTYQAMVIWECRRHYT